MSDQQISQLEIDALLSAMSQGSAPVSRAATDSQELQTDDLPLLRDFLAEFVAHAVPAMSTLAEAPCEGALADLQTMTGREVSSLGAARVLVGQVKLGGGLNGSAYYVFPAPFGAMVIRQLMHGADPSESGEESRAVLASVLSEASRFGWERLASHLGREVTVASASIREVGSYAEACEEPAETKVLAVGIDMAVGDAMGRALLVLPETTARPLVSLARKKQPPAPARSAAPIVAVPTPSLAPEAALPLAARPQPSPSVQQAKFPSLSISTTSVEQPRNLDLLMDVRLRVTVEIGRTRRHIRDVLTLGPGYVLELDRLANEQVDVLVNGKLVAKAEVVVVDENYGARITDIISPEDRVQALR